MTAAANESCFLDPHWRLRAQGFNIESWLNDGQAVGTGGIRNPMPTRLPTGNYYYRFASSSSSRDGQVGGGWWLDFENFRKIERFAQENDYSIREAARLMLALPYAWTRVDVMVKALLAVPLKAYAGEGKPAQGAAEGDDRGTAWIPMQHIKVCQLYIPGLFIESPPPAEQLYVKAFPSPFVQWLT